jgi:hypothetical protein
LREQLPESLSVFSFQGSFARASQIIAFYALERARHN